MLTLMKTTSQRSSSAPVQRIYWLAIEPFPRLIGIALAILFSTTGLAVADQYISASTDYISTWQEVDVRDSQVEQPPYGEQTPTLSSSVSGAFTGIDQTPPKVFGTGTATAEAGLFFGRASARSRVYGLGAINYGTAGRAEGAYARGITRSYPGQFQFIRNPELPSATQIPSTFSGSYTISANVRVGISTSGNGTPHRVEAVVSWSARGLPWTTVANPTGYKSVKQYHGQYQQQTEGLATPQVVPFSNAIVNSPFAGFNIETHAQVDSYLYGGSAGFVSADGFASAAVWLSDISVPTDGNGVPLYKLAWASDSAVLTFPINVNPPMLPMDGDYDLDGDVDGSDLLTWQTQLGQTSSLYADGSGNGIVDADDLAMWQQHFGDETSTALLSTAIPEPSSLLLLTLSCFISLRGVRGAERRLLQCCPPIQRD